MIRENFIPVALGFLNGGGGNSQGVQTASGEKIEGYPTEALKKWRGLPSEERRKVKPPGLNVPHLPEGGLAVRVFMRPLKRVPGGLPAIITDKDIRDNPKEYPSWIIDKSETRFPARIYAEPMGDVLWLTADEVRSLVPQSPEVGKSFEVPAPVRRRLIRMHLKNGTQGWLGWWPAESVRTEQMTLKVEKVAPTIRMTLEGGVLLTTDADPAKSKMGYEPKLSGHLEYDPVKKAFTRFDIVAVGDHWGPQNEWARPGRQPFGVAFELTRGDEPMDQAYPFALYAPGKETYFHAESKK